LAEVAATAATGPIVLACCDGVSPRVDILSKKQTQQPAWVWLGKGEVRLAEVRLRRNLDQNVIAVGISKRIADDQAPAFGRGIAIGLRAECVNDIATVKLRRGHAGP
jgi:hypothetical protein